MSVLVATAYMDEAEGFDWLVAMNAGKVLATGTPDELKSNGQETSLEKAFIKLLPEEVRRGHKEPVITPCKSSGGTSGDRGRGADAAVRRLHRGRPRRISASSAARSSGFSAPTDAARRPP